MMKLTVKDIRDAKTLELMNMLKTASQENDQVIVNIVAFELACRMYVPYNNLGITFEDILEKFGYCPAENVKKQYSRTK